MWKISKFLLFDSNGKWKSDGEGIKINSFGQNLMPEGPDNVKSNQNLYFLIRTANESLMAWGWKSIKFYQIVSFEQLNC